MFLAAGIDPQRSIVIVQSHVPQHSELAWILNTIAYMGELRRMTQFKDKTGGGEARERRRRHLRLPRAHGGRHPAVPSRRRAGGRGPEAARRAHPRRRRALQQRLRQDLRRARADHPRPSGARIMGLDDPAKKMSKSAGSANNYIALSDSPDVIRRKIKRAVTDSGTEVRAGPDKPALTNLLTIYSLLAGEPVEAIVARYEGKGYADFKADLGELVVESLAPFQRAHDGARRRQGLTRSTCCGTAPSAPRRSPSAPWPRCASASGCVPRPSGLQPGADTPVARTAATQPRRCAGRPPRAGRAAGGGPNSRTATACRARRGRPAVRRAPVVVGGEGAGRSGPPPAPPSGQARAAAAATARAGLRSRAPARAAERGPRRPSAGRPGSGGSPAAARATARRDRPRRAVERELDHPQPGTRRAPGAAARLTASWSGWPPS